MTSFKLTQASEGIAYLHGQGVIHGNSEFDFQLVFIIPLTDCHFLYSTRRESFIPLLFPHLLNCEFPEQHSRICKGPLIHIT